VESADEFTLGFDDVEGRPIQLSRDGDDEDDEGHETESDQVPVPDAVDWEVTMSCTESDPVTSTTVTIVMPRAAS